MPSFQEKSPLKSEQLQQSTVCQDFYYHSIISSIGTKNPNPFPIRKKFGFLSFRGDYGTRLLNLPLGANSYGDSQFLNWLLRYATGISHLSGFESLDFREIKKPPEGVAFFIWWRLRDSNPSKCKKPVASCGHQFKNWWQPYALPGAKRPSSPVVLPVHEKSGLFHIVGVCFLGFGIFK